MEKLKSIKVTLVRSLIGSKKKHRLIVRSMGLKKVNHVVFLPDLPSTRGMLNKASYLLKVEE
ncbi:50S ribosomal protein L30 [Nitrosomonas sp. HPC101]|uniref:50S ribosomal protein L30 n=1 Tax=Nitrosomonas sp. HPC101 TaxID=1658667 RepID=UPI00136FCB9E|nr:50S ribosomal protein L30 [Nitrosomonas sp. HPC101]MXS84997.1 50S ribosomal protein L30 [Nitrosomonas sp. HPC101]